MSKKKSGSKQKQGDKKGGGLLKFVFGAMVLVTAAGAAFWFLAPEQFAAQLDSLKSLLHL